MHLQGGFREDDLVVGFGYEGFLRILFYLISGLEQFEHVIQRHLSFVWILEIDFDHDLELAPTRFGDFVRRTRNDAVWVFIAFVQLEVYL